ncbi:MAG: dTMP kinase [Hyphomonadaceae bacterium]
MAPGRFISLEGGEGAGKSTLAAALAGALEADGKTVLLTREPGGTPSAEQVRELLLNPPNGDAWTPMAEVLLFYAARVDHLERLIRPRLAVGDWVICDRFSDSTMAYQTASDPKIGPFITALEKLCVPPTRPELTIVLDVSPEVSRDRMAARGRAADAIELRGPEFHARVREAFLEIARNEPERCIVLDAAGSPEALLKQSLGAIAERLSEAA